MVKFGAKGIGVTLVTHLLISLTSCAPDTVNAPPRLAVHATVASQLVRKRDITPSQRLARALPGFGGAFVDENGVLNVYLTTGADVGRARQMIGAEFVRMKRRQLSVRVIPAKFSFVELETFIDDLLPLLGSGVASVRVDERTNRLRVGIVTAAAESRILDAVAQLQLPRDAIVFEPSSYIIPVTSHQLTDVVRPLLGGLQVSVGTNSGSLGAIVDLNGTLRGLISAHLADPSGGGATGATVYQPTSSSAVGVVSVNPAFSSSVAGCPSGKVCRTSDAALFALNSGIGTSFGSIAATSGGPAYGATATTTLSFDDATPTSLVTEGVSCSQYQGCDIDYFPGDTATKVGYATGWTGGTYDGIESISTGTDNLTRLYSLRITHAHTDHGDSGGPVLSQGRNKLVGVVWGIFNNFSHTDTGFVASAWPYISDELGGGEFNLHSIPPQILGYEEHRRHDAGCPNNPDSFDYYVVYGYPTGSSGGYDARTRSYAGNTTYFCGLSYVNGNFATSSAWMACTAKFGGDCPCVEDQVGGSCTLHDP